MSFTPVLIAVDVGNSRIKLGRFDRAAARAAVAAEHTLPEPTDTLDLSITSPTIELDVDRLSAWCRAHAGGRAAWLLASVHRGAADRLAAAVGNLAAASGADWPLRRVTYRDVPITIKVDQPERVGIDRLLAALAANRIRSPGRAAIVVDLGSAITVDLVDEGGAFAGGAILPGLAMSARALAHQTDALPLVDADRVGEPPLIGKSTVAAIEAGLFWGAVGAIGEFVDRLSAGRPRPPDVLITGGTSPQLVDLVADSAYWSVRHVPHLVLAGVALVDQISPDTGSA